MTLGLGLHCITAQKLGFVAPCRCAKACKNRARIHDRNYPRALVQLLPVGPWKPFAQLCFEPRPTRQLRIRIPGRRRDLKADCFGPGFHPQLLSVGHHLRRSSDGREVAVDEIGGQAHLCKMRGCRSFLGCTCRQSVRSC